MSYCPSPLAKLAGLALVAGLVAAPWAAPAYPSARDDDDEEKQERREVSRRAFVENCLMCHGEDMTTRQRLTTKQWTAEVEKMVGWGAPVPPERKQPLIDYLAETYPHTGPASAVERIAPDRASALDRQDSPDAAKGLATADAARGGALFATHCASCHGAAGLGGEIGINLVEKPVLLREDEFRAVLREGRRRMPAFHAVLDADGPSELLAWLRGRR